MHLSDLELKQLDMLKKKDPGERFLLMANLIGDQIEVMKAGLRYRNPNMDDNGLIECLKARLRKIYSLKP